MKKVLFIMCLISSFSFATTLDLQEEIVKTKIEQGLAYMGVQQALGQEGSVLMTEESESSNTQFVVKVLPLNE